MRSFTRVKRNAFKYIPVTDKDLALRGAGERLFFLLAFPAFLPSVISSFFTQNKVGRGKADSSTGYFKK